MADKDQATFKEIVEELELLNVRSRVKTAESSLGFAGNLARMVEGGDRKDVYTLASLIQMQMAIESGKDVSPLTG